jgi:cytochrome c-type biogenesis protein
MELNAIFTSLFLGLLSSGSPCVLPLYPGFLVYLSSGTGRLSGRAGRYFLGFFMLAGVLSMMLALGGLFALLSIPVGQALSVAVPLVDGLILLFGVLLVLNRNPFKRLPQVQVPLIANPYLNAFIYGMFYGPLTLPCSGPLVVGIFAFSLTTGQAVDQLAVFFWFGIGFGLPLLVLSLLSGAAQRWLTRQFALRNRFVNLVGGILLIAVGLYDLWANWDLITEALHQALRIGIHRWLPPG